MIKDRIYFDYAAATPLDPIVLEAMAPFFSAEFYNPSATYLAARAVRKKVDIARADIAKVLGSRPAEIIFTSGATEANNLATHYSSGKPAQG
jgi:cysteine desulfurase